jgi:hypothetical protein
MAARFVCNLGWRFGRDYGLVQGGGVILELVTNRGGANVLLLPVFFGAGNRRCWKSGGWCGVLLVGDVDIGFFFLKWDEIEGELCLPRVGRALMVLCFP